MSIPFGDYYGATFKEAVIILESLQQVTFDEPEKEKVRLSVINYTESKLKSVYPYQWDDYFLKNPTYKNPESLEAERNK